MDLVPFVNEQVTFHRNMAKKFENDAKRSGRHTETAAQFLALLAAMEAALQRPAVLDAADGKKPVQLFLTLDEVNELPEELLQELSFSEADKTEYAILRIIEECGGVSSIDRILFSLYKKTKEILKRTSLTSKLYRMVQKGQIFPVPTKKGVYSTKELTDAEAELLN